MPVMPFGIQRAEVFVDRELNGSRTGLNYDEMCLAFNTNCCSSPFTTTVQRIPEKVFKNPKKGASRRQPARKMTFSHHSVDDALIDRKFYVQSLTETKTHNRNEITVAASQTSTPSLQHCIDQHQLTSYTSGEPFAASTCASSSASSPMTSYSDCAAYNDAAIDCWNSVMANGDFRFHSGNTFNDVNSRLPNSAPPFVDRKLQMEDNEQPPTCGSSVAFRWMTTKRINGRRK
jgi:hypothetical protein